MECKCQSRNKKEGSIGSYPALESQEMSEDVPEVTVGFPASVSTKQGKRTPTFTLCSDMVLM